MLNQTLNSRAKDVAKKLLHMNEDQFELELNYSKKIDNIISKIVLSDRK